MSDINTHRKRVLSIDPNSLLATQDANIFKLIRQIGTFLSCGFTLKSVGGYGEGVYMVSARLENDFGVEVRCSIPQCHSEGRVGRCEVITPSYCSELPYYLEIKKGEF